MVDVPKPQKPGLLACLLSWPPHYVFLVCFLFGGIILCGGSFALSIHDLLVGAPYSCQPGPTCGQRQVGYLWAPNWSLGYAILGPLSIFLMLQTLRRTRDALNHLFQAEMVRAENMTPVTQTLSSTAWEKGTRFRDFFNLICAGVVPAMIAYPEWFSHNFMRLKAGACGSDCGPADYDWGLAAMITGTGKHIDWHMNAGFDFLAFTAEALLLASTILCFLYLLDLERVIPGPDGGVPAILIPNLRSSDPRRGFQNFEEPLQFMLSASLALYLICYSIRINRIYMRSTGYTDIFDFIQRDIIVLVKNKGDWSKLLPILLNTPANATYQDYFSAVALILLALFSLSVIIVTVRGAALHAKEQAEAYYERPESQSLFGLPIEEERERLRTMTTWPLEWRYFQLNTLLVIMGFALATLWFYRIGFYIGLVAFIAILSRIKKALGA